MASIFHILVSALFSVEGNLLLEIGFILLLMGAVVWIGTVRSLARHISIQFFAGQTYKTKQILRNLAHRVESQELTIRQAEKELEKMGSTTQEDGGTVVDGPLGTAITALRDKLESLRRQDTKQNWVSKGIALISGIRKTENQFDHYTARVISSVAKYLNANQAAFFILAETQLKLTATYAFDRSKYGERNGDVSSENGLLGQCVTEKELIHIEEVPKNYVKVMSGLGEATSKSLVVAPLIYRDQVYGVFEIASLKDFEPQHLEFIQRAAEEVASELGALQIQNDTKKLLEQAQAQATQLTSHEEELKQNMEEMQATQEEMRRKEVALEEKLEEIEFERAKNLAILETCMDAVISFNIDGTIEFCNKAGEELLGYSRYELAHHSVFKIMGLHVSFKGEDPILLSKTGTQITTRTEVNASDRNGEELSLLLTATLIRLREKSMFTLFAQKISVDLF